MLLMFVDVCCLLLFSDFAGFWCFTVERWCSLLMFVIMLTVRLCCCLIYLVAVCCCLPLFLLICCCLLSLSLVSVVGCCLVLMVLFCGGSWCFVLCCGCLLLFVVSRCTIMLFDIVWSCLLSLSLYDEIYCRWLTIVD